MHFYKGIKHDFLSCTLSLEQCHFNDQRSYCLHLSISFSFFFFLFLLQETDMRHRGLLQQIEKKKFWNNSWNSIPLPPNDLLHLLTFWRSSLDNVKMWVDVMKEYSSRKGHGVFSYLVQCYSNNYHFIAILCKK